MLLSSLCNLIVFFISSPKTLFLSGVISLSINVHSAREFRRLATFGNTATKLADNELESIWSRYSSNPFQSGKVMLSSSYVPHDHTDEYKASIFSGFAVSPPLISNIAVYFLLLYFSSPYFSTINNSSAILDGGLSAPQC